MANSPIKQLKALGFPWETQDPFLFCVHHLDHFPKGNDKMGPSTSLSGRSIGADFGGKDGWSMYHGSTVPGFPAHPHTGFETVTIVLSGLVDHADSLGAAGRFGNGDVQWMTAGKGVQHSEMFPLLNREGDNPLELFQIWLNLPRKSKKVNPHFSMLWGDTIPVVREQEGKVSVIVIAGTLGEAVAPPPPPDSWAADPANEVAIWRIKLAPGTHWTLPAASPEVQRSLYFFKGRQLVAGGQTLNRHCAMELHPDQAVDLQNGDSETHLLLLQGKPIQEPVVQHGPFVTNSHQEVQEVMRDYQRTGFGGWPWPKADHVHPREAGRFALHADGRLEQK